MACNYDACAVFGAKGEELVICSDSNENKYSWCLANRHSFKLPADQEKSYPSMNGGKKYFKNK
jgi:hypothetical protein